MIAIVKTTTRTILINIICFKNLIKIYFKNKIKNIIKLKYNIKLFL